MRKQTACLDCGVLFYFRYFACCPRCFRYIPDPPR